VKNLLPILLIVVLGYLMVVRPAQRRQQAAARVASVLEPGARVMTTAGLFGTVRAVQDDEVELEIAPGVVVRYVKGAIAKVVEPGEPGPSDDGDAEDLPKNSEVGPDASADPAERAEVPDPESPDRPATPPTSA